ncbi:MAG: TolB family protein [Planctomycetota bacterium]
MRTFSRRPVGLCAGLLLAVALAAPQSAAQAEAQAGQVSRVSISSRGDEGTALSYDCALSQDGRFVAFASDAPNLVDFDGNNSGDIFVHDRLTGVTTRESLASDGTEANDMSYGPSLSADGRFLVFESWATNLVPGDTNGFQDVFLRDRLLGKTIRVSVGTQGQQAQLPCVGSRISLGGRAVAFQTFSPNMGFGPVSRQQLYVRDFVSGALEMVSVSSHGEVGDNDSWYGHLSFDGRYVAFASESTNFSPIDLTDGHDIYVHDRQAGTTRLVSVSSTGGKIAGTANLAQISADGRYVVFESSAVNLVPNDNNGQTDVFLRDRWLGVNHLVSVGLGGLLANERSGRPSLSLDGRYVAFHSNASNLVLGDGDFIQDVFRRDVWTGLTEIVATPGHGTFGNGFSLIPSISGNGRVVAFESHATNLVAADVNEVQDAYVRVFND